MLQQISLPFTLNSKPTPGGRRIGLTSRTGGASPPLSVPGDWANNPVSTVQLSLPPAKFNPTVRHTFESRLVEAMINDYWDYLLVELPARGLITARELEYLRKSGLLGRFMSENQVLINCFRLGCS